MPATVDSKYLNMQMELLKPKTTWDKGKIQQQTNITIQGSCWSSISESQVPASLLIQTNIVFGSSVHLQYLN